MIDLYTWTTPNGRKVSILLEELGVDYVCHPIDITKSEQFAASYLAINPNGKIPAIVDRDAGRTLFESGAIMVYLADKYGRFLPRSGEARDEVMVWLMWQMGGFGPMLGQAHHFLHYAPEASAYAAERYAAEARRLYGVLDRRLEGREHVAGDYSIADMAIWPWVARFAWQRVDLPAYPNVRRWYEALAARPQVQRGYARPFFVEDVPLPRPQESADRYPRSSLDSSR